MKDMHMPLNPIHRISSEIIGEIAARTGLDSDDVSHSRCEAEMTSSNPNNWTFTVHLPTGQVAVVGHDGPIVMERTPQAVEILES